MTVTYHRDIIQGTEEWANARLGVLTASEMKHIITPTLKVADNADTRIHLFELLAQRTMGFVDPGYCGDAMMRGYEDEIDAKQLYARNYAPVEDCGFITNDRWGFTLGYSPDGLTSDDKDGPGLIEVKSKLPKLQMRAILEDIAIGRAPAEFMIQLQTGLLVSERKWVDFITYSAGLPMATVRVFPDSAMQEAIIQAATAFEDRLATRIIQYASILDSGARLLPTERRQPQEIHL